MTVIIDDQHWLGVITTAEPEKHFSHMDDDDLCHIMIDDHNAYCGWTAPPPSEGGAPWCEWNRKAICKDCGLPTCPKCAQLESLERRLEKA